jgi:hypothetical protein
VIEEDIPKVRKISQKGKNPLFVGGGLSYRVVKELTVDSGCS